MNFGLCIHVAVDETHLHLTPARVLRWVGAGPISVPWESIRVKKTSRNGKWTTAFFGPLSVMGPTWCLQLAESSSNDPL
jgi:hypothetical protein